MNIRNILLGAIIMLSVSGAFAQRYLDNIADSVVLIQNIKYGFNRDYRGDSVELYMDIYLPHNDTVSNRPLLVLAHGGSFLQGNKSSSDMQTICTRLAKKGYVVASIQYRLGVDILSGKSLEIEFQQAVWRGAQDGRAAIRFLNKTAANGNEFKFNPEQIYTGGVSAGGVIGLQLAFLDKATELSTVNIDTSVLGGVEGNSGNPGYSWKVKGVINLCGAMGNVSWMSDNKDISICNMHGTADATVPYKTDYFKFFGTNVALLSGGFSVDSTARIYGLNSRLYTFDGAPHVPFVGVSGANKLYMDTTIEYVSRYLYKSVTGNTPSALAEPKNRDNSLLIFPNPATNWIQLSHESENLNKVEIYSMNGQLLQQWFGSDKQAYIQLNQSNAGLYLLKIETNQQTFIKKLRVD